jgi:hypothetical protein
MYPEPAHFISLRWSAVGLLGHGLYSKKHIFAGKVEIVQCVLDTNAGKQLSSAATDV